MKYNTLSCMLITKLAKFGQSLFNRTENRFMISVCSDHQSVPFYLTWKQARIRTGFHGFWNIVKFPIIFFSLRNLIFHICYQEYSNLYDFSEQ